MGTDKQPWFAREWTLSEHAGQGALVLVGVLVTLGVIGLAVLMNRLPEAPTTAPRRAGSVMPLQLLSSGISRQPGIVRVDGRVRNATDARLRDVVAVVEWYTADGRFVASSQALVTYTTLMPGQISPFVVMEAENPLITNCQVSFRTIGGERLLHQPRTDD